MNNFHYKFRPAAVLTGLLLIGASMPMLATDELADPNLKTDYTFPQTQTPEMLTECSTAVFFTAGNGAYTTQGNLLGNQGQKLTTFKFSPAGNNYVLISDSKKGAEAAVYSPYLENKVLAKFKNKVFGEPSSAVYTPDARRFLLANKDGRVLTMSGNKFAPIDTLQFSFAPTEMVVSPNGYYLAITDGHKVEVYNFEEKKLRQSWLFDSNVNDMAFNDDTSGFAVATDDGMVSIYDTRSFVIDKMLDDMGDARAIDYNPSGKYMAVATDDNNIKIVNLLTDEVEIQMEVPEGELNEIVIAQDANDNSVLYYTTKKALKARRLWQLSPYYGKLIKEEVDARMNEWMRRMDGESLEAYNLRISEDSRRQRQLIEAEVASNYANNLLAMSTVSLGSYDRANKVLQMNFDNMPPIFLPVDESDLGSFDQTDMLEFRNTKYGVMNDDNFELIYAEVYNRKDGKTYIYDNLQRVNLNYMENDDNVVSLDVIQQQMMEEMRLEELRSKIVAEAKEQERISDHTHIGVSSKVVPTYDANGEKILNYVVNYVYEVEPDFVISEDFPSGKYRYDASGAASAMLQIMKESLEGDLASYMVPGKKVLVKISGSADGIPVQRILPYDGAYGDFEEEPVYKDGQLGTLTVTKKRGIQSNEELAFARGAGVHHFLENNVKGMKDMKRDYQYHVNVAHDKGGQFRRVTTEITFVDAFKE